MRIKSRRKSGENPAFRKSFLSRLARDRSGNTLAIVGAALVPISAMIGSGVDMSRAYMAKTRLQSACDAAALAGRRVMTNDTIDADVLAEANQFFDFNFPDGLYGTNPITPSITRPESGTVRVAASTTIPTTVMGLFGFESLPLDVTCDASLNFVNTDIILVLDTTGSMLEDINGNATGTVANQKITALRNAVMALYDVLEPVQAQLEANGLRLRIGIVPYSSTVNVGQLIREVDEDYLADDVEYQTRVANFNTPYYVGTLGTPEPAVQQVYSSGASISQSNCDRYGRNVSFSGFSPSATSGGGPAPAATWSRSFSNNEASGVDWGYPGAPDTSGTSRSCRRRYVETDTTYTTEYTFTNWSYEGESLHVANFNEGDTITYATNTAGRMPESGTYDMIELASGGTGFATATASWNGCIMERDTVDTITNNSGLTIPAGAYDLNIDYIPDSDATRWRPHWPGISYYRTNWYSLTPAAGNSGVPVSNYSAYQWPACPTGARRLQAWSESSLQSYINTLDPDGYTYHDIGMIWGARLISPEGIFGDSPDEYNGMPVSRHVIFMTDGVLNTAAQPYGAYGIEGLDRHISGGFGVGNLTERHRQRFRMICEATKSMNVSIWVVAFASTLEDSLVECASNENQASLSANQEELIERFQEIGSNIGALRLTQ